MRVDRDRRPGRVVVGGPLREIRRAAGRRLVHLSVEGDHRLPWIAGVPGARILQAGFGRTEVELDEGINPDVILSAAIASGATVTHFEVDEVSLEQIFINHVGRPADEEEHLAPDGGDGRSAGGVSPTVARDEAAT